MRNAIKIRQNAFSESNLFTLDLSRRGRHFYFLRDVSCLFTTIYFYTGANCFSWWFTPFYSYIFSYQCFLFRIVDVSFWQRSRKSLKSPRQKNKSRTEMNQFDGIFFLRKIYSKIIFVKLIYIWFHEFCFKSFFCMDFFKKILAHFKFASQ